MGVKHTARRPNPTMWPLGILNKLKPSDIFPIIIAAFTSGIYEAEHPVFRRFLAWQIGNMR